MLRSTGEGARGGLRAGWPLGASLLFLWALAAAILLLGVRRAGGFAYALDDAYIHLAMGRNLAQAGTWGIGPEAFSGASSSPLWTLLLAGVTAVAGDHAWTPLVLNLLAATLLLVVADAGLRRHGVGPWARVAVLVLLVLVVPVAVLVVSGMEHLLQATLALAFVLLAARLLSAGGCTRGEKAGLLALAFLLVGLRYEDAFLVGVVAVAAWLRGWRGFSAVLLLCGAAPPLLYGLFSMAHGWPFLPTSILAKATPLPTSPGALFLFAHQGAKRLLLAPHVLVPLLLALGLLVARGRRPSWSEPDLLLAFFAGAALLHPFFALFGWFYRYEAYLVALGVVALAIGARDLLPEGGLRVRHVGAFRAAALALLLVVAGLSVSMRAVDAHLVAPIAMDNIHDQHLPLARFLHDHYAGEAVAVNDVGAVSYLSGVRVLDLWGLGDQEVAEAMRAGSLTTETIRQLALERGVAVAVLHEPLFRGAASLPPEWEKQGEWVIRDNHITAGDTLSFFAVRPGEGPRLAQALAEFAPRLPEDVVARPG